MDARERIVAFMPEYGAYLANRIKKAEGGKIEFERARGKKPTVLGLEFGEKLLFRFSRGPRMEKINPRWEHGIFVVVRKRSNEVLVSRPEGITAVRSVRRIPLEKKGVRVASHR